MITDERQQERVWRIANAALSGALAMLGIQIAVFFHFVAILIRKKWIWEISKGEILAILICSVIIMLCMLVVIFSIKCLWDDVSEMYCRRFVIFPIHGILLFSGIVLFIAILVEM